MNNYYGLIGAVLTVLIGVVLVGSLLAPTISGYTTESATFENEGVPFATPDEDTHTITVTSVDGAVTVTTDDEVVEGFEYLYNSSVTLVYASVNVIRLFENGNVQILGTTDQSGTRATVGNASTNPVTITITGDIITAKGENSDTVWTLTGTCLAYPTADTDAEYRQGTQHYFTEDSNLIIAGGYSTTTDTGDFALIMTGTPDNLTGSVIWYYSTGMTFTSADVQTSNVCTDLYNVDKIVATCTITATEATITATYTQFLSTATGTYDDPDYLGDTIAGLLAPIVVLSIAGLLVIVVYRLRMSD